MSMFSKYKYSGFVYSVNDITANSLAASHM